MSRLSDIVEEPGYPLDIRERAATLAAILASNLADQQCLVATAQSLESLAQASASYDHIMVRLIVEHDIGSLERSRDLGTKLLSRVRIDPREAALWANTLGDVYIEQSLAARVESARKAMKSEPLPIDRDQDRHLGQQASDWLVKADVSRPIIYAAIVAVLLGAVGAQQRAGLDGR